MNVLMVCPYDLGEPGGVQSVTRQLRARLEGLGHTVSLTGPGEGPDWTGLGPSLSIPGNGSVVPLSLDPGAARRLRTLADDADVVHVHEPLMPVVSLAAMRTKRPTVATFHAAPPPWVRRTYRLASGPGARLMRGAVITAVSATAASAIPPSWGDVAVIPNGIDVGSFDVDQGSSTSGRVLFVGRDEPRKGLDVLLDAWPSIRERFPDATLHVVGAERSPSIAGVTFLGRVSEEAKRRAFAEAEVFVAPNLGGESFGIVLTEAMATGTTVVASDLPAFEDVLGGTGLTVPVGGPVPLAEAVVSLLADPARREELAAAASLRVREFDWTVVCAAYVDAYDRARMSDSL